MRDTPFDALTEADLQRLVSDGVPENRQLEYKRDLWPETGEGQKEFLKDLASFANAQGGDLIVGIAEQDHIPVGLVGVAAPDPEGLLLSLESRYRSRIEPPLSGVRMGWISLADERQALVIRVPGSLRAPHRDRQSGHFPIRGERRIDQMGIDELRDAFLGSEQLIERLRRLHLAPVDVQNRPELPFPVSADPAAIVSVMPLDVLRARRDLPVTGSASVMAYLPTPGGRGSTITLEGIIWATGKVPVRSFAITHRQGRVDAFWTLTDQFDSKRILPYQFDDGLLDLVADAQTRLRQYGVDGPWVVMTSLVGIHGAVLPPASPADVPDPPVRRVFAHLPDALGEQIGRDELAPVFKAFWRLFGRERPAS